MLCFSTKNAKESINILCYFADKHGNTYYYYLAYFLCSVFEKNFKKSRENIQINY